MAIKTSIPKQQESVQHLKPRLISKGELVANKPSTDAENDLSLDLAESVGKTIGNIVNEIESLDKRRDELIGKLSSAREAMNQQFAKWLPAGLTSVSRSPASKSERAKKDAPCSICGFKTNPLHDARAHRSQTVKGAYTDAELSARGMTRV
jgi:hypothetical protein